MEDYRQRITIDSGKRGGKPCIHHMRITVYDILGWLAAGMSNAKIIWLRCGNTSVDQMHAKLRNAA